MRIWSALSRVFVGVLLVWAVAGFFMGGEDELQQPVPWLVVLGGGIAGERLELGCRLFSQGHGYQGVVLTGGNLEGFVPDRAAFLRHCGLPNVLLKRWPATDNSYQEMSAVRQFLVAMPSVQAIVVSDALHMPRLRYLREKFALNGRVYFRQSNLGGRLEINYLFAVVRFWFREPLAYVFYRVCY